MAIVVHGRWDAFDLARELHARGLEIGLFTNYPAWAVQRFGVPVECIRAFPIHGALVRACARLGLEGRTERVLHAAFGGWAASRLAKEQWDVVYAFSGVAEEAFQTLSPPRSLRVLVRESAHVRAQDELLQQEQRRTGVPQARPSAWRIAREEREYALADLIRVLSSFTYETFVEQGTARDRLALVVSGAAVERFRPPLSVIHARISRIESGEPLRILNVGTFALRKGMWDMAALIRQLGTQRFRFRFVGPILPEASSLADDLARTGVEFVPKQPEAELPASYAWGDVFVLPSIEDGFPAVLAHASAAGLPILTTPNGAGRDLVRDGSNGWVLPVRAPGAFAERLDWADKHRLELATMARDTYEHFQPRDFSQVAAELETVCRAHLPRQVVAVGR
jgi:glycosyltransferase involved in cell wall biosynthesis